MFFFEEFWITFKYVGNEVHGIVDVIFQAGEGEFGNGA